MLKTVSALEIYTSTIPLTPEAKEEGGSETGLHFKGNGAQAKLTRAHRDGPQGKYAQLILW